MICKIRDASRPILCFIYLKESVMQAWRRLIFFGAGGVRNGRKGKKGEGSIEKEEGS